MRNIDASEWLTDPALDILETKGAGDAGSDFTLNAVQENPQLAANADEQRRGATRRSAPMSILDQIRDLDPNDPGRWPAAVPLRRDRPDLPASPWC